MSKIKSNKYKNNNMKQEHCSMSNIRYTIYSKNCLDIIPVDIQVKSEDLLNLLSSAIISPTHEADNENLIYIHLTSDMAHDFRMRAFSAIKEYIPDIIKVSSKKFVMLPGLSHMDCRKILFQGECFV